MRILQVVKTSEGAQWAAAQAAELVRCGLDVHAALPAPTGAAVADWRASGAHLHFVPLDLPVRSPGKLREALRGARALVERVQPDIIHSHFVGTTLTLRMALGRTHPVPRLFQVAGPLHMEYAFYRQLDLRTAGPADYWLASSRCTRRLYLRAGVPAHRVFLGYYGIHPQSCIRPRTGAFRSSIGIESNRLIVGNINLMYPPKRYLGQFTGLKCHETVIDALGIVCGRRPDVTGVLVGGEWGGGHRYEDSLRLRAIRVGKGRILLPGRLSPAGVATAWPDFDCAIHFPLSENTGGVHEALLNGVPTIAGRVGALPEIVIDGLTGKLIDERKPASIAEAILEVLDDLPRYRSLAVTGCKLVSTMCDVRRTAPDVALLYRHILNPAFPPPAEFDSVAFVKQLTMEPLASSIPGTVQ